MKKSILIFIIILSVFLCSCGNLDTVNKNNNSIKKEIFAMDTVMQLTVNGENAADAVRAAEQEINRLERLFSTSLVDSEVWAVNTNGKATLSDDSAELIKASQTINHDTNGAFDITIYPLVKLWGFHDKNFRVPSQDEIDENLKLFGSDKLVFDENTNELSFNESNMAIDFGGIAKGYTSERIINIFKDYGIESAVISLGGNVQTLGHKPDSSEWSVGIQDPDDNTNLIGTIKATDLAVITSGGYQRFFEEGDTKYHHILDPKTGKPANNGLKSVSIVCDNGTLADGLSTSLFVMGTEKAIEYWKNHHENFDTVLITDDDKIIVTSGLAELFSSNYDYEIVEY